LFGLKKKDSLRTGFEPVRENPNRFQVCRLNHSAIAALSLPIFKTTFIHDILVKTRSSYFDKSFVFTFNLIVVIETNDFFPNINWLENWLVMSCDGRVVKATDLKSVGIFPHRFKSCSQRIFFFQA
jgi:hypothetical protein